VHVTLLSPPFTLVGLLAAESEFQHRARRRLLLRSRPGSSEDAILLEVEVEAKPYRARQRPPSEAEVEAEPWGRARRSPPSEAEAGAEPWGRARRRPPSEAEAGAEPWGRARWRPPPEVEAQGRARRSFLLRLRLGLAVVSLTLAGGTAVGEGRAALFSYQVGQWKDGVTAVTSTLPTEARVSG
jgi:hypothetical protein